MVWKVVTYIYWEVAVERLATFYDSESIFRFPFGTLSTSYNSRMTDPWPLFRSKAKGNGHNIWKAVCKPFGMFPFAALISRLRLLSRSYPHRPCNG